MKKSRIYVDTSVIGGCCDPEFQEWSNGLLLDFQNGTFLLLLSELTDAEVQNAPDEVIDVYSEFRKHTSDIIEITSEAMELADAYLNHKILTHNFRNDARPIAVATVAGADLLVSWNFKHIVHFKKIQKFNAVNVELGYKPMLTWFVRSGINITKKQKSFQ